MERHIVLIKKTEMHFGCFGFGKTTRHALGNYMFSNLYCTCVNCIITSFLDACFHYPFLLLHCWRSTCYSCDAKSQQYRLPHGPIDGIWWSFGLYFHLSFGYLCPWLNAMAQEMDSHLALSLSISSRPEKPNLGQGWVVVGIERQHDPEEIKRKTGSH